MAATFGTGRLKGSPGVTPFLKVTAYSTGWEAEISLSRFLWRHLKVKPPSFLGGRTAHEVYTENDP
jgi:hypothetical protein